MIIGNILDIEKGIIVHQVNCRGVMGSGLAKQISDKYPKVKEYYLRACKSSNPESLIGYAQFVEINKDLTIVNLFGQVDYGREPIVYTHYGHLSQGLRTVWTTATLNEKYGDVYVPYKLGCGLANGDWDIVRPMVEDVHGFTVVKREGDI